MRAAPALCASARVRVAFIGAARRLPRGPSPACVPVAMSASASGSAPPPPPEELPPPPPFEATAPGGPCAPCVRRASGKGKGKPCDGSRPCGQCKNDGTDCFDILPSPDAGVPVPPAPDDESSCTTHGREPRAPRVASGPPQDRPEPAVEGLPTMDSLRATVGDVLGRAGESTALHAGGPGLVPPAPAPLNTAQAEAVRQQMDDITITARQIPAYDGPGALPAVVFTLCWGAATFAAGDDANVLALLQLGMVGVLFFLSHFPVDPRHVWGTRPGRRGYTQPAPPLASFARAGLLCYSGLMAALRIAAQGGAEGSVGPNASVLFGDIFPIFAPATRGGVDLGNATHMTLVRLMMELYLMLGGRVFPVHSGSGSRAVLTVLVRMARRSIPLVFYVLGQPVTIYLLLDVSFSPSFPRAPLVVFIPAFHLEQTRMGERYVLHLVASDAIAFAAAGIFFGTQHALATVRAFWNRPLRTAAEIAADFVEFLKGCTAGERDFAERLRAQGVALLDVMDRVWCFRGGVVIHQLWDLAHHLLTLALGSVERDALLSFLTERILALPSMVRSDPRRRRAELLAAFRERGLGWLADMLVQERCFGALSAWIGWGQGGLVTAALVDRAVEVITAFFGGSIPASFFPVLRGALLDVPAGNPVARQNALRAALLEGDLGELVAMLEAAGAVTGLSALLGRMAAAEAGAGAAGLASAALMDRAVDIITDFFGGSIPASFFPVLRGALLDVPAGNPVARQNALRAALLEGDLGELVAMLEAAGAVTGLSALLGRMAAAEAGAGAAGLASAALMDRAVDIITDFFGGSIPASFFPVLRGALLDVPAGDPVARQGAIRAALLEGDLGELVAMLETAGAMSGLSAYLGTMAGGVKRAGGRARATLIDRAVDIITAFFGDSIPASFFPVLRGALLDVPRGGGRVRQGAIRAALLEGDLGELVGLLEDAGAMGGLSAHRLLYSRRRLG